jgi:proteasome accessory factor C
MSRRSAESRLRRLLVMLPWLMERGEVPLAEVAERFDMSEAEVTGELELVAMCGLPPYVDEMVDVFVDDGVVFVGVPRLFTRALRLTAPEGFSLLAAGRAALELPGADPDGPLARGLSKLATALGAAGLDGAAPGADDTAGVAVDLARPPLTDALVDAVSDGAVLEVDYYSPARDEVTGRTIVPRHVFVDGEHWYVVADDDRSGERRTFRIDRIERASPTGEVRPTSEVVGRPTSFFADAEVPRATLRLAPAAHWVLERYPVDSVEPVRRPAGWVEVVLPIGSDRWLQRLLIRLGPDVKVVAPARASDAAAELAARILARYR